ncbi:hypothetical protein MMC18_002753 [Xylographa bjoerkii]|nr:hypothetical protein [Xylographa bjoerkii]
MANNLRILVIAGSDCSGGAGLEADQKVIAAFGCYAMTATTALTVQDTQGVYDIHYIPSSFVKQQIDVCVNDIGVDVVKTVPGSFSNCPQGMLASATTIQTVAKSLESHGRPICVVDPVMVSTSGTQLLPQAAVRELREHLLPLTTILTPNVPEAKLLIENATGTCRADPQSLDDLIVLAKEVQNLGAEWVLLKGGHLPLAKDHTASPKNAADPATVVDILYDGTEAILIETAYLKSKSTHGTGCSLASAISCGLALGYDVPEAVQAACKYVEKGIRTAVPRGKGNGPINHFHTMPMLPRKDSHHT